VDQYRVGIRVLTPTPESKRDQQPGGFPSRECGIDKRRCSSLVFQLACRQWCVVTGFVLWATGA